MNSPVITNPLFNVYFGFIKKYTPNLHKCPYKKHEEIMLKNLTVDYNLIPPSILLLEGNYRLDVNYYSTKYGESVYYAKVQIFLSIHRRNPYKKRTKSGRNWRTIYIYFFKEVRNATEAHTALMRGSPCVPRTLQMQLMRINICSASMESIYLLKIISLTH